MTNTELAEIFLQKSIACDIEAKKLKTTAGSTHHLCSNIWRAAACLADPVYVANYYTELSKH